MLFLPFTLACFLQMTNMCSSGCCEGPAHLLFMVPCSTCQNLRAVVCAFHSAVRSFGCRVTSLPLPSLNFESLLLLSVYLHVSLNNEDLEDILKTWLIKYSMSFLPFPSPLPKHRFSLQGGPPFFTIYLHFFDAVGSGVGFFLFFFFNCCCCHPLQREKLCGFQVLE